MQNHYRISEAMATLTQITSIDHMFDEDVEELGCGSVQYAMELGDQIYLVWSDMDNGLMVVSPLERWDPTNLLEVIDDQMVVLSFKESDAGAFEGEVTRTNRSNSVVLERVLSQSLLAKHQAQQIRCVPTHCTLSHPVAEQLQGKSIAEQVKLVLVDRCRFLGEFPSRRVMQNRYERVIATYNELVSMGFQLTDISSFGLKHAQALLESWKARGISKTTICTRWDILRSWVIALGKNGMLGTIGEHWPDFK